MSYLDEIAELRRDYGPKYRHLKFLRRKLTPEVIDKLAHDFDSLWEVEKERIFPRVNEFPTGARRILHPKETDRLGWLEMMRINDRVLSFPPGAVEEEIVAQVNNAAAVRRLKDLWRQLRACAARENEFADRHLPTFLCLISQCPGGWLEQDTHFAFRRLCVELPGFIETLEKDIALFKLFTRDSFSLRKHPLQVNIIGIGEITTTIELLGAPGRSVRNRESGKRVHYAVKKMPPFPDFESAERYAALYDEYHRIIKEHIGIRVPAWGSWIKTQPGGKSFVYNWQERLPQESIAALVAVQIDAEACRKLFRMIMGCLLRVFRYNRSAPDTIIGFDGQLPNWSVVGYRASHPEIRGDEPLIYFDTSTPLMRRRIDDRSGFDAQASRMARPYGPDLLDTEIFLKTVPIILRPIVRVTALKEVVNRYYVPRKVITDLIASFYLYGRPEMVPILVQDVNEFIKSEMPDFDIKPFTEKAMAEYHRTDTMIWVFFRAMKRMDRWVKEKLLGVKYEQRLPKKKFTPGPYIED